MTPRPRAVRAAALAAASLAWVAPFALLATSTMRGADWQAGWEATFATWTYYAVPWGMALGAALAAWASGHAPLRAAGLALMTVPAWETLWGILDGLVELLQGGFVLRAYSTYQLSLLYSIKLLDDLGYLAAGFLLYAGGPRLLSATPALLARRLAETGFPMGRRSEAASMLVGVVAFPLLLLGTLAVNYGTAGLESLRQSDESSVFDNMTLYHAVLISLAAAFSEELLYRGLVQTAVAAGAAALLRRTRIPRQAGVAVGAAIAVQAVFFGFAHSGYATWIHVLLPTLFGVVSGVAAWRFGIWSAIVLHFTVDIFAFVSEIDAPWAWTLLNTLFLANVALSLGWAAARLLRRYRARHPTA